ncbi:hypothetical protein [Lignipirellula cremea]|uniref:hypothetical protein n=1 Tax=Lignipirellula cremea TaxID=2528010 RepID=UPI0011A03D82|nr:hypothetical protein [Lignipirellula cremea]
METAAPVTSGSITLERLTVGFEGRYKVGYWTPIALTFATPNTPTSLELELIAPDGDGDPARYLSPLELSPDGKVLLRYVKFGRRRSRLTVIVRQAGEVVLRESFRASGGYPASDAEPPRALFPEASPADQELIVSLGGDVGIELAQKRRRRQDDDGIQYAHVALADAAGLPDRWFGYEGVDQVLFSTAEQGLPEQLSIAQFEALDGWLQMGGRLVFCVGQAGERLLAGGATVLDGRFRQWAPGRVDRVASLRRTAGLEAFAGSAVSLESRGSVEVEPLSVAVLEEPIGQVLASEGGVSRRQATVVRSSRGFGSITFVAFDLDRPPLSAWEGRAELVQKLLYGDQKLGERSRQRQFDEVTHVGYDDMSGQLRAALDQFRHVKLTPFSWVAGLIGLYILIIGPGDYFLLKWLGKRMHWTWVTFPLAVLLFCGLAVLLASRWKGDQTWINQVDVVDLVVNEDGDADLVRGTSWCSIYSPAAQSLDLTLPVEASQRMQPGATQLLSWQGLPGDALGGMNASTLGVSLSDAYRIDMPPETGGDGRLEGLPIQTSSTRTLVARWRGESELRSPPRLRISSRSQVEGQITNPFDEELTDGVLFYGRSAYRLKRPLPPRAVVDLSEGAFERTLDWHLTRKTVDLDNRDVVTPWDKGDLNVARIMEIMMLHDAAGGRTYTELRNRYQGFIDITRELEMGRAVFVARAENRAATLHLTGAPLTDRYDRHWTFYRFVLPVKNNAD